MAHWGAHLYCPGDYEAKKNRNEKCQVAARILTNYFANEGMEVIRRRYLLEIKPQGS